MRRIVAVIATMIAAVAMMVAMAGCGTSGVAGNAVVATGVDDSTADSAEPAENPEPDAAEGSDTESEEESEEEPEEEPEGEAQEPEPPGNQVRYLAIGDSLSQGIGADDPETGSFPALLAGIWRDQGCDVELDNAGIAGYTAQNMIDDELPHIEDFGPTLITFQTGANDIATGVPIETYQENVRFILQAAADSGARVIVMPQNEWFRSPEGQWYGEDLDQTRAAFDEVMIQEAEAVGAEFIDLRDMFAEQADNEQWVEDGIHPTPDAYQEWAERLAEAVPRPCDE